jgi:hypothetical protein
MAAQYQLSADSKAEPSVLTSMADTNGISENKLLHNQPARPSTSPGTKTTPQPGLGGNQIGPSVNLTESAEDNESYNKNSRHEQHTLLF